MDASSQSSHVLGRRAFRLAVVVGGATIAAAIATGVVFAAQLMTHVARPAVAATHPAEQRPPAAAKVATELSELSAMIDGGRIGQVSCLQGDPGSYVCSYVRAGADSPVCAVAMLKWTPQDLSRTYSVQASGRVALAAAECGPVKKVLHVLGTSG